MVRFAITGILNGTIRDFTYLKKLGEKRAHQFSTITLLLLMSVYCFLVFSHWQLGSESEAITAGITWLTLTVAFEFLFGHFFGKHSWKKLISQYNILSGNLWLLVIIWTAVLPLVYYNIFID